MVLFKNKQHVLFYVMCLLTVICFYSDLNNKALYNVSFYVSILVFFIIYLYGILDIFNTLKNKTYIFLGLLKNWFYWIAGTTLVLNLFDTQDVRYSHYAYAFSLVMFLITITLYYSNKGKESNIFSINRLFIVFGVLSTIISITY